MLPQEKVQNLIDRHRKLESDLTSGEIDKKKYAILKKRNRNKKIKFFKSIDDINIQNNFF